MLFRLLVLQTVSNNAFVAWAYYLVQYCETTCYNMLFSI